MNQLVTFPTNYTPQKDGTITETCIDLVLTNNTSLVSSVQSKGQLGASKHIILEAELIIPSCKNETVQMIPDYSKADFDEIRKILGQINWSEELIGEDTEGSWNKFKEKLTNVINKCIPKKKRRYSNRPMWMKQNIMRIIRKKHRQWKWYCTTKDYAAYQAYQKTNKLVSKAVRKAKRTLEKNLAKNIKSNPKAFYRYMNNNTKTRSKVGPLKDDKNQLHTDDAKMVEILNTTFTSVFTAENLSNLPNPEQLYTGTSPLNSLNITEDIVKTKIENLNPNKSPGPDLIHPSVVKKLVNELVYPITIIFNKSLQEGVVPADWKNANVTAIYKKGDRTAGSNYRPISLTSLICRIMESLLRDAIVTHLRTYNLIRNSQHGFMPHRSCLTNLLEFLEEITKLLDEGHSVDLLYLDFARAFDKVPHARLIAKVKALGITGQISTWIEQWLTDRRQRVVLNGSYSTWKDVTSGVPQGSVLGPCLFIIFINDIDSAVDVLTVIKKFADDTKTGSIVDTIAQCENLQRQLDNFCSWSEEWQMLFNLDKCKVMHLGSSNLKYTYSMNGQCLKTTDSEKDLGVYICSSMKPSMQVAEVAKKANQALGQLLRAITYRDKIHFVNLYKERVRCHLEYCVQAWNPWSQHDIDLLENVQKRAVGSVAGLHGSYEEKLKQVGLTTLAERRQRGDMIQSFKILNGIDDVNPRTWFTPASDRISQPTRSTTHILDDGSSTPTLNVQVPKARLDLRRNFFSNRVVNQWNALPSHTQKSPSVNTFKNRFDAQLDH